MDLQSKQRIKCEIPCEFYVKYIEKFPCLRYYDIVHGMGIPRMIFYLLGISPLPGHTSTAWDMAHIPGRPVGRALLHPSALGTATGKVRFFL